ncbi:MAG TPA: ABC transporter substrate-binding protein [Xanthobacteraceae bacterium]|nr:ABC transporter substrate-binding protein [Xanthobacteraceae bacterium]
MNYTAKAILATTAVAILAALPLAASAQNGKTLKLGFMSTMSGPIGALGAEQKRALDLAIADLGGKIGGLPVEVSVADDQAEATAAVQAASKLIDKDQVDLITGIIASPAMVGASKTFIQSGKIVVSANAGPSIFAGKGCSPNLFFSAWQNDQADEAVGVYLNKHGFKKVFFLGFDNQAGYDHINGAKRTYKGAIVGEAYTQMSQLDFSAEIAKIRASGADALFAFLVGAPAVSFVKQYGESGLKSTVPAFSFALSDPMIVKAQGNAALGIKVAGPYFAFIDNPQNKKFVAEFRQKYDREPTFYAANQYDTVMLLDAAIKDVGGNVSDTKALRAAIMKANFKSLRGDFKFNYNHFPIQDYYIAQVEKAPDGGFTFGEVDLAVKDGKDSYYEQCKMPE